MKHIYYCLLMQLLTIGLQAQQQPKYYQVKEIPVGTEVPNWRDTLFIVKVSDPQMQQEFTNELALPWSSRSKIVVGELQPGDGGFNRNGTHCFSWHMEDATVHLMDGTTEVCDGWPYTDCELADFTNVLGYYCPWSMRVWSEVPEPEPCTLGTGGNGALKDALRIFPNPVSGDLTIAGKNEHSGAMVAEVFDQRGIRIYSQVFVQPVNKIPFETVSEGVYTLILTYGSGDIIRRKIIKAK